MTFYQFASDSPWLTFFLFLIVTQMIWLIVNRVLRAITIYKHGYPPDHCDADGDFEKAEDD